MTPRRPGRPASRRSASSAVASQKARSERPGASRCTQDQPRCSPCSKLPGSRGRRWEDSVGKAALGTCIATEATGPTEMTDGQRLSKAKSSAGILAYRRGRHGLEVPLVHPAARSGETKRTERRLSRCELEPEEDPEQTA